MIDLEILMTDYRSHGDWMASRGYYWQVYALAMQRQECQVHNPHNFLIYA